jgi:hypothetical protein
MKRAPEKTVGVYERPEKTSSGLKIALAVAAVILLALVAAMLLLH